MKKLLIYILFGLITINSVSSAQESGDVLANIKNSGYSVIESNDNLVLAQKNKSDKKCIFYIGDKTPKIIMPPKAYSGIDIYGNYSISDYKGNITVYYKDKKFNNLFFDNIQFSGELMLLTDRNTHHAYYQGKLLKLPNYDNIILREGKMFVDNGGKQGILKENGEVIVSAIYDDLNINGDFIVAKQPRGYNIFYKNKLISSESFDEVKFDGDYLIVKKNGLYGVYYNGEQSLKCIYDSVYVPSTSKDYLFLIKGDEFGALYKDTMIVDCVCEHIEAYNGYLIFEKNRKYGAFKGDKMVLAPEYSMIEGAGDYLLPFKNSKFRKYKDGKLSEEMTTADIQPKEDKNYDKLIETGFGYAVLKKGILNIYFLGDLVATMPCDDVEKAFITYYIIKKDGKYGIFRQDKFIANIEYDSMKQAYYHYVTSKNGKKGLFSDWNFVEPIFDEVKTDHNYEYVRIGNKWGFYYHEKEKIPVKYDKIEIIDYGKARCTLGDEVEIVRFDDDD